MKKWHFSFLLVIYTISGFSPAFSIDLETLRDKLNYPSSIAEITEAKRLVIQNISLTEQILFQNDSRTRINCNARANIIQILKGCAERGTITEAHFFDIMLRLYTQIPSMVFSITVDREFAIKDEKGSIRAAMKSFGDEAPLVNSFSTFPVLTNSLSSAGFIKNQGILNSLNQKISNAQKSLEKRDSAAKTSAANQIQAAINELNAQKGQGVTEDAYQILSAYCQNLITKIQTTNP